MTNLTEAPDHRTEHKLTAAQILKDCPARLQQIGREITERLKKADKQTQLADDHVIAVNQLLAEAKELCDGGGFNKFRELFCPQLKKSQAYALLAIARGKKTFAEHRAEERERRQRTRANQKTAAANSGKVPEKSGPEAEGAPAPPDQVAEPEKKPEAEPEADVEPEPINLTKLDYSGLMKEYKKLDRAYHKLEGKQPLRKGDDEEWITVNDWRELIKLGRKQVARIIELEAALNAQKAQESRNWPADMTPKQLKLRDKCLRQIGAWQRDLDVLYSVVTKQCRPVGDDDPTGDDAPTSGEKRKAVNAEKFAALDAGSET